jgi:hypothetical protein
VSDIRASHASFPGLGSRLRGNDSILAPSGVSSMAGKLLQTLYFEAQSPPFVARSRFPEFDAQ